MARRKRREKELALRKGKRMTKMLLKVKKTLDRSLVEVTKIKSPSEKGLE